MVDYSEILISTKELENKKAILEKVIVKLNDLSSKHRDLTELLFGEQYNMQDRRYRYVKLNTNKTCKIEFWTESLSFSAYYVVSYSKRVGLFKSVRLRFETNLDCCVFRLHNVNMSVLEYFNEEDLNKILKCVNKENDLMLIEIEKVKLCKKELGL